MKLLQDGEIGVRGVDDSGCDRDASGSESVLCTGGSVLSSGDTTIAGEGWRVGIVRLKGTDLVEGLFCEWP